MTCLLCDVRGEDKHHADENPDSDRYLPTGREVIASHLFDLRIGDCCSRAGLIIYDHERLSTNFADVTLEFCLVSKFEINPSVLTRPKLRYFRLNLFSESGFLFRTASSQSRRRIAEVQEQCD